VVIYLPDDFTDGDFNYLIKFGGLSAVEKVLFVPGCNHPVTLALRSKKY
jgi:hypothetical protein